MDKEAASARPVLLAILCGLGIATTLVLAVVLALRGRDIGPLLPGPVAFAALLWLRWRSIAIRGDQILVSQRLFGAERSYQAEQLEIHLQTRGSDEPWAIELKTPDDDWLRLSAPWCAGSSFEAVFRRLEQLAAGEAAETAAE
jgi:hypothetical protein